MINVAIADNHPLMRQGVRDTITSFENFEVTIEASNGRELIERLNATATLPDICIIDIGMPLLNGYDTLKELKKRWPSLRVLIFSMYYTEFSIYQSIVYGANGCLEKNCNSRRLLQALSSIYHYDYYYTESVAKKIFELQQSKTKLMPNITEREMEFLRHSCSELSYKEIGELMGISVRTIEAFRDALFIKFNIKTRAGLIIFAMQNGIVPLTMSLGGVSDGSSLFYK